MKRVVIYLFSSNLSHITGKQEAVLGFVGKPHADFLTNMTQKSQDSLFFHPLFTF